MAIQLKPIDQQVIVITGASSGIGLATADMAAERGAKLVLAARSKETLDSIVRRYAEQGVEAVAVAADVGVRAQVAEIAEAAISRFGRIDTWVNDAGVSVYGLLEEVSEEDSRRLFDTNFWGVVNGSLAALPYLKAGGGALINVGSEVSEAVIPLQGMYSASKHAVKGFTDALRVELKLGQAPVSVTLVEPTAVNTPYPQHAKNYTDREAALPTPQIDPAKVADAILDAATHQRREVKVGMMAKINTNMAHLAPTIADWMASKQADRQHYDEPPRDRAGALYEACEKGAGPCGRTHGLGARGEV
ncbi:SDR family oxidoreductase [Candidatus Laterigemmans baculatus]|uniref:SDR family oxidoreductase n=1 Tax=Candidatus Laterigemmans baculatus TaxID=2770505 RepID=UPI0013DA46E2|nr:SDR family oxidoreductase [Candidatus Laterigemmans baculatus]